MSLIETKLQIGAHEIPWFEGIEAIDHLIAGTCGAVVDRFILISDETIFSLHGPRFCGALAKHAPVSKLILAPGEGTKNFKILARLCEDAIASGATRHSVVVALGGGVVGNISGVLATLLFRGVRLIHLPTTLLAASDSVISLKSAINSVRGKNLFGSYIAPWAIIIEPDVFTTLSEVERLSGLAELVKNVLTVAPDQQAEITSLALAPQPWSSGIWLRLIELGAQAKIAIMREDPCEQGPAIMFEYGHTVGHAIELADLERRGSDGLRHGLSVAIGMHIAAVVAEDVGVAVPGMAAAHARLFKQLGLPTRLPAGLSLDRIRALVLQDNKRGRLRTGSDQVPMVLLEREGRVAGNPNLPLLPVPIAAIERALKRLETISPRPATLEI
jgi:3-dehydroquinate synthase/2-deoxy-scyllo-inosose synthase